MRFPPLDADTSNSFRHECVPGGLASASARFNPHFCNEAETLPLFSVII